MTRFSDLVIAQRPLLVGFLDSMPVAVNPLLQDGQGLGEGSTEFGELVERGGFNAAGVEVSDDQPVAFGSTQGVGEDFV